MAGIYVTHMLHHNKNAKKSDICSLCQQGKDDILHLFEDCSTIRILKKMMLGRERIGIKLLMINTKENNIEKSGAFIKKALELRKNVIFAEILVLIFMFSLFYSNTTCNLLA